MYKVQQCCKWDYYRSIIQEAEVAGCLCCFLHSFPQLCGSSAPICPVSAGHSIKSSCLFSQITDQLQLSISVRPAHKYSHSSFIRSGTLLTPHQFSNDYEDIYIKVKLKITALLRSTDTRDSFQKVFFVK